MLSKTIKMKIKIKIHEIKQENNLAIQKYNATKQNKTKTKQEN